MVKRLMISFTMLFVSIGFAVPCTPQQEKTPIVKKQTDTERIQMALKTHHPVTVHCTY